jgi:hypothetical protein
MDRSAQSKEVFDYGAKLIEQLGRVEETITKFALQNYAACGAVLLAYFTEKLPFIAAALAVYALSWNFAMAIAHQAYRVRCLYAMHRTAQECWLTGKSRWQLNDALRADPECALVLTERQSTAGQFLRMLDFRHPVVWANLLPLIAMSVWALYVGATNLLPLVLLDIASTILFALVLLIGVVVLMTLIATFVAVQRTLRATARVSRP